MAQSEEPFSSPQKRPPFTRLTKGERLWYNQGGKINGKTGYTELC